MAYLQVESGELSGNIFEIGSEPLTIGRAPENQIILNDTEVSSHHCSLIQEGDLCKVEDQGSTNGTLLNEMPVKTSFLQDGDVITVGPVSMTFRTGVPPAELEAPAEDQPAEEEEIQEAPVPEPAFEPALARESAASAFKPRRRKNPFAIPLIAIVVICVMAAGVFFLKRLFSY
jgi:pSer/pThr/pTyr-binding forkhead associated (FHA) protein